MCNNETTKIYQVMDKSMRRIKFLFSQVVFLICFEGNKSR